MQLSGWEEVKLKWRYLGEIKSWNAALQVERSTRGGDERVEYLGKIKWAPNKDQVGPGWGLVLVLGGGQECNFLAGAPLLLLGEAVCEGGLRP